MEDQTRGGGGPIFKYGMYLCPAYMQDIATECKTDLLDAAISTMACQADNAIRKAMTSSIYALYCWAYRNAARQISCSCSMFALLLSPYLFPSFSASKYLQPLLISNKATSAYRHYFRNRLVQNPFQETASICENVSGMTLKSYSRHQAFLAG